MVKPPKRASKRTSTKQREKIKKKVSEHHRKARRAAKKDVTWKSKKRVDPGIPNSYPFKEQLLQEIEEKRNRAEEERRAQKAARKTGALPAAESDDEDAEAADEVAAVGDEDDAGEGGEASIAALLAQSGALAEPAVPLTFRGTLADLYAATQPAAEPRLRAIVFAVDARDPIGWRTPLLEEEQVDAQKIIALTRADLVPLETLAAWQASIAASSGFPVFPIASPPAGESKGSEPLIELLMSLVPAAERAPPAAVEAEEAEGEEEDADIKNAVVVVGMEHSGRTTLAKLLAASLSVAASDAAHAATTVYDSPPLVAATARAAHLSAAEQAEVEAAEDAEDAAHEAEEDEEAELERERARDERAAMRILMRNQGAVERIKEPLPLVYALVRRIISPTDLMLAYNVPAFGSFVPSKHVDGFEDRALSEKAAKDAEEFLIGLARARGRNKKGDIPDTIAASRILLRDWSSGALGYYTAAPAQGAPASEADVKAAKAQLAQTLGDAVQPRKEWRKRFEGREVRLRSMGQSLLDERVALSKVREVVVEEDEEDEEEDDEDEEMEDLDEDEENEWESDEAGEDEEDEEDEEAEEVVPEPVVAKPRSILKKPSKGAFAAAASKKRPSPAAAAAKAMLRAPPKATAVAAPKKTARIADEPLAARKRAAPAAPKNALAKAVAEADAREENPLSKKAMRAAKRQRR